MRGRKVWVSNNLMEKGRKIEKEEKRVDDKEESRKKE